MNTKDIEEQTDFSEENLKAHQLLQRCIKDGYTIRIDDLVLTEYPDEKIISLKPNTTKQRWSGLTSEV